MRWESWWVGGMEYMRAHPEGNGLHQPGKARRTDGIAEESAAGMALVGSLDAGGVVHGTNEGSVVTAPLLEPNAVLVPQGDAIVPAALLGLAPFEVGVAERVVVLPGHMAGNPKRMVAVRDRHVQPLVFRNPVEEFERHATGKIERCKTDFEFPG